MNTIFSPRFWGKLLLAYSMVIPTVWLAACSGGGGGYGGGGNPTPATMNVNASLSGAQETPPNTVGGTGSLTGTYDPSTYKITYTLTWTGLTGDATGMHFHGPAAVGQSAAVQVGITGFPAGTYGSVSGNAILTVSQAADLTAGKWYVNIHTAAYPGGEIRGQVSVSK
ncbi:MAG TPA: CHRD domain-containing protein [Chitinophaga sp.]|uniref:CHRD domain-containing protein n=1 Tax=Chitinophaga sp. TaxID=1869181 RepID=UPI002B70B20F|nr:CHRD domain-containing protein [Chitinophaga sp.]HVI49253.1 CHRD domain-containing protein [Chitinophaga sp.]